MNTSTPVGNWIVNCYGYPFLVESLSADEDEVRLKVQLDSPCGKNISILRKYLGFPMPDEVVRHLSRPDGFEGFLLIEVELTRRPPSPKAMFYFRRALI